MCSLVPAVAIFQGAWRVLRGIMDRLKWHLLLHQRLHLRLHLQLQLRLQLRLHLRLERQHLLCELRLGSIECIHEDDLLCLVGRDRGRHSRHGHDHLSHVRHVLPSKHGLVEPMGTLLHESTEHGLGK